MLDPTLMADLPAAHFPDLAPALHAPATYPNGHRQLACFAAYIPAPPPPPMPCCACNAVLP